jgi:hypothetical protein
VKIYVLVSPVVLVGVLALAHPAQAKSISISGHGPGSVKKGCGGGGVYFPPDGKGAYGCINGDGSGIVCGGSGKYAKTCDTWGPTPNFVAPNNRRLPDREEVPDHTDTPK